MQTILLRAFLILACAAGAAGAEVHAAHRAHAAVASIKAQEVAVSLSDFGAVGDGATDDGPALQAALEALAESGGGTLIVPQGRYAIITPVNLDFSGRASAITIQGVASSTTVDTTVGGRDLARGLNLVSEFVPQTGSTQIAIQLTGLQSLLLTDIAFVGRAEVATDASITLSLDKIEDATVHHCEFYGLASETGAIITASQSRLKIEQSKFLGCGGSSGAYLPIVQNLRWKSITITDTVFIDYGLRPELYSKTVNFPPFSWVNIGNAEAISNDSPRREVIMRNVFLDEGAYDGLASLPYFYQPQTAPIDLVYITGLRMNVTNFGGVGHYLGNLRGVLIENSLYGWSHYNEAALSLRGVDCAILDRLEFQDDANRIFVDEASGFLTVIDSNYQTLDSQAESTKVISTHTIEDDPVQYVRGQYQTVLGREPDPAGHFYWSDRILKCDNDQTCVDSARAALAAYLAEAPPLEFSITGQVMDEDGKAMSGVHVALSGSQAVSTETDENGRYHFNGLPTSGDYTVTVSQPHYTFSPSTHVFSAPTTNPTADFTATRNHYTISGKVTDLTSTYGLSNVTINVLGYAGVQATTDTEGNFSLSLPALGTYTLVPSLKHYSFQSPSQTFYELTADQFVSFGGRLNTYTVSGFVTETDGTPLSGVYVTLSGYVTTTNAAGHYSFANVPAGRDYTLNFSKPNYNFAAASRTITDLSSDETVNFSAPLAEYVLSGRISAGAGWMSGVTVTLSGSQNATTTTDANGAYSFTVLAEGNYTITPSKVNYTFNAPSQTVSNLSASQMLNFTGQLVSYRLSGNVHSGTGGLSGVTIMLSGSQSATTTTDIHGDYSFTVTAEGNYAITPSKANYSFTESSHSVNNLGANEVINFSGALVSYNLSGRITAGGHFLSGASVTLSGSQTATTVTGADGAYSFTVIAEGNYTITPSKANYSFTASSQTVNNLSANQVFNFNGSLLSYRLNGRVSSGTSGMSGVTITLLSGSQTWQATTDAQGDYVFTVPAEGNYTVTPSKMHYSFNPASATFNNLSGDKATEFTATLNHHQISGRATTPGGHSLPGVQISLSGAQSATATTDANGNYSFADLPAGGNYTITASKTNYSFAVPVQGAYDLGANQVLNFTGSLLSYQLSGQISSGAGWISGVTVTLSGSQNATTTTDANGAYSFTVLAEGNYTVTPSKTNYTFNVPSQTVSNLSANQMLNFTCALVSYQLSGRIVVDGHGLSGVTIALSGSQSATTVTDANGNYSLPALAEGSYTLTPSEARYDFSPQSTSVSNLGSNRVSDFTAKLKPGVPVLISQPDSTRALAIDAVLQRPEPFQLAYAYPWTVDARTRVILFATNFDLSANETAAALSANVEDASHRSYPLTVEYVGKVPGADWLKYIIIRLNDDLKDVGDVLVRINYHGLSSNRVRLGIGHIGGGPPDDPGTVPTPGRPPQ